MNSPTAGKPASHARSAAHAHSPFDPDQFFGRQRTPTDQLPPPEPLLENLTRCVMEVLAGARELDQLARWISEDVYKHLLKRQVVSARARQVKGLQAVRPVLKIGRITVYAPRDGVVEAVVMVHQRTRSRAVAIRLEGMDRRWRATAISVL
ncbi:MAG: Rv3235 family protein [Mycetocola sp.]